MSNLCALIALATAYVDAYGNSPAELIVQARAARHLSDSPVLGPDAAAAATACAVISQEHSQLSARVLEWPDENDAEEQPWRERYAQWAIAEILGDPREVATRYRLGQRLIQEYRSIKVDRDAGEIARIDPSAVYVVTGAFGRIGPALGRHLASRYGCRVLLLGRRNDAASAVHMLEGLDPRRVMVRALDIADVTQVRQAFEEAQATLGPIRGIFHLAADTRHRSVTLPLTETTLQDIQTQWKPKLQGLDALSAAAGRCPLDFAVAFSSNTAVLGGMGRMAYGTANAVMNTSMVALNRASGVPWIAICWDGLLQALASSHETSAPDPYALDYEEAIHTLMRVISALPAPVIAVSSHPLSPRLSTWLRRSVEKTSTTQVPKSVEVALKPSAPQTDLERRVATIWQEILDLPDIGVDEDFFDAGGDSLLALRVLVKIRELFDVNVSLVSFFNGPTIRELIVEVVSQLAKSAARDRADAVTEASI